MKKLLVVFVTALLAFLYIPTLHCKAGAEGKPEIKDGKIYLPEKNMPEIPLEKLNFTFPKEMPKELLDMKGNIYRGELERRVGQRGLTGSQVTYLTLWGYSPETKEVVIYFIWEKYSKGKPGQKKLKGVFNPGGETVLNVSDTGTMATQEYRLSFLKDGKLRINTSGGASADYSVVGKLPESQ